MNKNKNWQGGEQAKASYLNRAGLNQLETGPFKRAVKTVESTNTLWNF